MTTFTWASEMSVEVDGTNTSVDANAGIFITMNPAGKGYGGRQKLPDNLKQLFRPVAMAKADQRLIAEEKRLAQVNLCPHRGGIGFEIASAEPFYNRPRKGR